jgi:hypothetical protein
MAAMKRCEGGLRMLRGYSTHNNSIALRAPAAQPQSAIIPTAPMIVPKMETERGIL